MINTLYAIYFSPTGNTEKITCHMAKSLAGILGCDVQVIDLTLPEAREKIYTFGDEDFVIIGAPTYAGKLPNKILPTYQENLRGNKSGAIAVVTYGNRAFDNSLAELSDTLQNNGFILCGAAAVVGEHPFSAQLGTGRPNEEDLKEAEDFVRTVAGRIREMQSGKSSENILARIPGDAEAPYYVPKQENGQPAVFLKAKPLTNRKKCTECKICAQKCPMGSIDFADVGLVTGICIKCQSCIKNCPQGAKSFEDEAFLSHVRMLENSFDAKNRNTFL